MASNLEESNVVIEYHCIDYVNQVTLKEFNFKKEELTTFLRNLRTTQNNKFLSQYIAINFDVQQYCISVIIASIIESKFSFVFKSKPVSDDVFNNLTINLIFSCQLLPNCDMIFSFTLHNHIVYLLKDNNLLVKEKNSVEYYHSSELHFLYAITTSGTTGSPKIVQVADNCIFPNISDFTKILKITSADKIAQLTPLTFDPSMIEILLSLKNNCCLFMVSEKLRSNPLLMLHKMITNKVTVYQTTPSLLFHTWSTENLKNHLFSKDSSLRILLLGGEPLLKHEIISSIRGEKNNTRLFNVYGITELSCWSSLHEVMPDTKTNINYIGKPLSETIFQVRNENGTIIENGEGILYIGSETRICIIDDESIHVENLPQFRNSGDFVEIKSDDIYYIGRSDATIKRLGHKVNLSQLENHTELNDLTMKCKAIWNKDSHKLHLFVIPVMDSYDHVNLKAEIRNYLNKLDSIYQPDEIHFIKNFPLTEHGKICKKTLKKMSIQREKPHENLETILRDFWVEHLTLCNDQGFLTLGGNSITALQISNILSDLLSVDLSELVNILLNNGTFIDILNYILKESKIKVKKEDNCNQKTNTSENLKYLLKTAADNNEEQSISSDMTCIWQKSRGDSSNEICDLNIEKIEINKFYDLKKCIDASPTIFKCSSGSIYVTVGSHSGIIYTVPLNNLDSKCYRVQLPDRIEASVLVLDGFIGIVGCYDGYLYCVQLNTGNILWKCQTGSMIKCTALECKINKCLFVGSYDTFMYCLNTKDGHEIWKIKVSSGSITAKPSYSHDKKWLLVSTLNGTCAALDVNSGQIKWKKQLSHPIFSSPAVLKTGHVIFCTVIGDLVCFDVNNNLQLWTYSLKLNTFSYPIVHDDPYNNRENICIIARDTFFCLECNKENPHEPPSLRYKTKLRSESVCTPWCEGNIIILADSKCTVYILNFHDGILLTEIKLGGEIFSSPVLHNDNIVIGCRDNQLYLLKLL